MEPIYVFLILNDVWIYIVSAAGLFWFGSQLLQARHILRRAMFGLEREKGTRIRNNALFAIFFFAAAASTVYYVNDQIAPTLPPELFKPPTPTPNIFATPLSSPTPLGTAEIIPPTPTPPLVPTITLAGQPAGTLPADNANNIDETPAATSTPELPTPTPFVNCTADLNINEPRNGAFVSGAVSFFGTADTENFGFYKLETNGPETNGQWASLLGRTINEPVRDGFLGNVNLSQWGSGPYLVRLTAVDANNNETGTCVIQVTLNNS